MNHMTFDELKEKALTLPLAPGVYIMHDKAGNVIYVGKAKKLKNRVSQYFQDTASHSPKTRMMVSKVSHFDVIVAASEFEALILECSLIKRHLPKYNILLKDDKGFPYVRLDLKEIYPSITMVSKVLDDGAEYFGPFGSRGATQALLEAIGSALQLPTCKKEFPKDIGKDRPCLNYHMNRCAGWCQERRTASEYRQTILQAKHLLQGNYKATSDAIRQQMLAAADNLEFELAASLRDRFNAVETLGQKQLVTAGTLADTDVIGYGETETKACFAVMHYSAGNLLDKDYEVFPLPDDKQSAVSSLLKQYYLNRGFAPKNLLLPFELEDSALFAQLLEEQYGRKSRFKVPSRGDNARLIETACKNAYEEAHRMTEREEKHSATLLLLSKMLAIDPPRRIEAYDISHISGTDIVGAMVVFEKGKSAKSQYKRFKLEGMTDQDDYASMRQILTRRFKRYVSSDKGFDSAPNLVLIDGGENHAKIALDVLRGLGLTFPVFGVVKDDRHRTRALVTAEGQEIRIDNNQVVFAFIGTIQEEVHRFAISYHRQQRSNRLKYSELDQINGIGAKRKQALLKHFGSLSAISAAELSELEQYLPHNAAVAVYQHFQKKEIE